MGACWQFVKSFTPVLNAFKEKVINGAISITSNFTSSKKEIINSCGKGREKKIANLQKD